MWSTIATKKKYTLINSNRTQPKFEGEISRKKKLSDDMLATHCLFVANVRCFCVRVNDKNSYNDFVTIEQEKL